MVQITATNFQGDAPRVCLNQCIIHTTVLTIYTNHKIFDFGKTSTQWP